MVETADATTSRAGVSSQGAGLGATAEVCPVPDADPLGAVHGRLVHGQPRDGVCFPAAMRFTHCRLYGQRPMTECRREPQGDSLLVGHRIDSVNDGLAVEQLVLPGTAFRLPAYGMLALAPCLPPSPAPATGKLPGDIAGIAVGVTVA